jgi:hypothetical protein
VGPRVRIRLAPAGSLQTLGPGLYTPSPWSEWLGTAEDSRLRAVLALVK